MVLIRDTFFYYKIKQYFLQDFEYSFILAMIKWKRSTVGKFLVWSFRKTFLGKNIDQLICTYYKKLFVLKKIKWFAPQKTRKHLAEALIISEIDYGNIIHSSASQNRLIWLQKLLKVTCSFVNGGYSNSLDVIFLGWLPISERIDFCIIKRAHEALHVTPFPSYLKLSFKILSRYFGNKDEFLINNYGKNSKTFIGKALTLFNILACRIRSISSFKSFLREVKKYLLDQAQAKYFQRH